MNNFGELLEKLAAKQFDALIGVSESVWLDAKESPYILDTLKKRLDVKLTASGEVCALCSVRPWTSGALPSALNDLARSVHRREHHRGQPRVD
jgi:hypothetical protein